MAENLLGPMGNLLCKEKIHSKHLLVKEDHDDDDNDNFYIQVNGILKTIL